jgi:hypothetical protein
MQWSLSSAMILTLACCASACARSPGGDVEATDASSAGPGDPTALSGSPSELSRLATRTRADRAAWRARLGWPDDCEQAFEMTDASTDSGVVVQALEQGAMLVAVRCAAGAYQPSALVIQVDAADTPAARVLTFATYVSPDGETLERVDTTELRGEIRFAAQGPTLSVLALSRQTRDCGTWAEYTLVDRAPRLVTLYARLPCPGTPDTPVDPAPDEPPPGWKRMDAQ